MDAEQETELFSKVPHASGLRLRRSRVPGAIIPDRQHHGRMRAECGRSCGLPLPGERITSGLPGGIKSLPIENFLRSTLNRLLDQAIHSSTTQSVLQFETALDARHNFLLKRSKDRFGLSLQLCSEFVWNLLNCDARHIQHINATNWVATAKRNWGFENPLGLLDELPMRCLFSNETTLPSSFRFFENVDSGIDHRFLRPNRLVT
jgi:hypothetical protein